MSEIRALIQKLVDAGVDPIEAAEVIARAAIAGAASAPKARSAGAIRQERYRRNKASQMTESDDYTPHPPSLDKETSPTPPKEINPSPLTPQTTPPGGRDANELGRLSERLCDAADGKMQPQSALVVGPILEMIAHGVDLETDVLPVIGAVSARLSKSVNLSYFLPAIRDAHERRIAAGKGVTKRPTPEASDRRWQTRLTMARAQGQWSTVEWGPAPGQPGCVAPKHLLQPGDGEGWREWQSEAA